MGSDHYSVSLYFAFRQRLCLSVPLVCCFFACTGCDFVLRSDGRYEIGAEGWSETVP
jgi:hypothetical protein